MGSIGNPRDYLILTNNPMVKEHLEGRGRFTIRFEFTRIPLGLVPA